MRQLRLRAIGLPAHEASGHVGSALVLRRPRASQSSHAIANLAQYTYVKLLGGVDLLVNILLGLEIDSLECRLVRISIETNIRSKVSPYWRSQ